MNALLGDEPGTFWLQGQWTDLKFPLSLHRIIGTLLTVGEDDALSILGSAFVIRGQGEIAICIGAAHSFEQVKRQQHRRTAKGYTNIAPGFELDGPEYVDTLRIRLAFVMDGAPVFCRVGDIHYTKIHDVIAFTAKGPPGTNFAQSLSLGFDVPRIGEEVTVLAHQIAESAKSYVDGVAKAKLERPLVCRRGTVTDISFGPSDVPGRPCFTFRTTIPTNGGMSGAPVISAPVPGEPIKACGVISTDRSAPEAFGSFMTAGDSAVSMIWPAMALKLPVGAPPRWTLLADLLQSGVFDDRSDCASIEVERTADKTAVVLVDEHGSPQATIQLNETV